VGLSGRDRREQGLGRESAIVPAVELIGRVLLRRNGVAELFFVTRLNDERAPLVSMCLTD
jgi:hypothetical protein